MSLTSLSVFARTSALIVVLGGLAGCPGDVEPITGQGGSSGQAGAASGGTTGSGGRGGGAGGGGAGGASCSPSGTSSTANWARTKELIGFYCGGTGCHNEGQAPNLFPPMGATHDAMLYKTLTEYKVTKCGGRLLVKPCAPEESALYRAQTEPTMCESLPQMPFGCGPGRCTDPADLEDIRQWIANGATMN